MSAQVYRKVVVQIAVLALLVGIPGTAKAEAEIMFVSESAIFDPVTQAVLFTIEFNQAPDFFTVDAFGRQKNSFQYYIVGAPNLPYPANFDAIIRGEEIHITSDAIRIRNSAPSVPDTGAGGWGAVRGVIPFSLKGNVLTFSVPLHLISDHSLDGAFAYQLESYQFGSLTKHIDSHSVIVPGIVQIDIKPGSNTNPINPRSKGKIPVAILTSATFNALAVNAATVRFGAKGTEAAPVLVAVEDVNGDGRPDLLLHFNTQETRLQCGQTSALLTGETLGGQAIHGADVIQTVECK
ncbi:MAG: hypothetical protein U0350_28930 [Caldilineaceae bacterium]